MSFESESEKNTHDEHHPDPQKKRGIEVAGAARARASRKTTTRSADSVHGTLPARNTAAEEPPRLLAVGARRQVARKMLVHEKKLQEITEPARRQPMPGHRNGQKQRQAPRRLQPAPRRDSRANTALYRAAPRPGWPPLPGPW